MAAIVNLTETQKAKLVKMLNNLHLGFVYSGFGEAFVGMINGTPVVMSQEQKAELRHLINNLNLGTWHGKTGDLLVDLMGAQSGPGAAKAMTVAQRDQIAEHLQNLNLGLAHLDIGELVKKAVDTLAKPATQPGGNTGTGTGTGSGSTPTPPALAWVTHPTTGTIGTDLVFTWAGGSNTATDDYTVTVTMPDKTQHDKKTDPAKTYTLTTTNEAKGDWVITVESKDGAKITETIAMAAKP
ncbi:hypothetical protein NAD41_000863 [Salmonella enterica]|nr:hypothetical protein [Salmonella enterica]EKK6596247.1 hypothetical protein [Salmonella enterica]